LSGGGAAQQAGMSAFAKCSLVLSVAAGVALGGLLPSHAEDAKSLYPKNNWQSASGGEVNISSFVYRDNNRNGVHDLGDQPMADVAFEFTGPTRSLIRRTNISGMANYRMSASKKGREITEPGLYQTKVILPQDFAITTGNAVQSTRISSMPGAPADLFAAPNFEPVGLAPILSISGRLASSEIPYATLRVEVQSRDGRRLTAPVDRNGMFHQNLPGGEWTVDVTDGRSERLARRSVTLKSAPVLLSTIDLSRTEPEPLPQRHLANFDSLISSPAVAKIPHGYEGIGWNFFVVTHNRTYSGEGYINNTISGEYVAYNGSGHPVSITAEKPIDFIGSYFGTAWRQAEGEKLSVTGWRNDKVVYRDEIELSSMGPVYFAADYRSVTRIDFTTRHYWQVVFDDMSFGFAR
jgi:hypothetical protein